MRKLLTNFPLIQIPLNKGYYVYILLCADNTLYTGWTNNIYKRIKRHNLGKGAKYTSVRLPVVLIYYEEYDNKIKAMQREYQIKKLKRKDKENLVYEQKTKYNI